MTFVALPVLAAVSQGKIPMQLPKPSTLAPGKTSGFGCAHSVFILQYVVMVFSRGELAQITVFFGLCYRIYAIVFELSYAHPSKMKIK